MVKVKIVGRIKKHLSGCRVNYTQGNSKAVTIPTIVVHSDESALPENAKKLHETVQGAKELVWSDGNHFD